VNEGGWFPGRGGVTSTATCTELTVMSVVLFMAGIAIAGCALIETVGMATRTGCCGVRAGQFKSGLIVVVGSWFPGGSGMAGPAVSTELTVVSVIFLVAGIAIAGCSFIEAVGMAARTGCSAVCASQFKCGLVMVVSGWFPGDEGVAGPAVRTELAAMSIVFLVARKAIAGSAIKEIVGMATGTVNFNVRTG
jgi:hypothetical protein